MGNLAFDFAGRTVIVTGAARGIGLELARQFQQAHADVFMVDFDGDVLGKAAAKLGVRGLEADVSSTADVEAVVTAVMEDTGRIDVLVNNAGILRDNVLWNVTSYTGLRGNTGQANYGAAKAGIIGFTKTAAKELARFGVTVNAISPNAETRMIESIPADKRAELTAFIPLGRFAAPREMAAAVAFLASEEAGYVTGVVLPVDGGMSM
jgi:3-oxoacyl-[acyl-carrier protein] reductase